MKTSITKIDRHDVLMFRLCKSQRRHSKRFIHHVCKIWGGRCAIDPEHVNVGSVADHMLEVAIHLGLIRDTSHLIRLIRDFGEDRMWQFVACGQRPEDFKTYDERRLVALASLFAQTEVALIPGFRAGAKWRKRLAAAS